MADMDDISTEDTNEDSPRMQAIKALLAPKVVSPMTNVVPSDSSTSATPNPIPTELSDMLSKVDSRRDPSEPHPESDALEARLKALHSAPSPIPSSSPPPVPESAPTQSIGQRLYQNLLAPAGQKIMENMRSNDALQQATTSQVIDRAKMGMNPNLQGPRLEGPTPEELTLGQKQIGAIAGSMNPVSKIPGAAAKLKDVQSDIDALKPVAEQMANTLGYKDPQVARLWNRLQSLYDKQTKLQGK